MKPSRSVHDCPLVEVIDTDLKKARVKNANF